jgi:hypothetical protein
MNTGPTQQTRNSRHALRAVFGLMMAAVIVLAAACGSTKSNSAAATNNPTTTAANGRGAYRECLQQHGVTLPQRPTTSAGSTQEAPNDGGGGRGGGGGFNNGQPPAGVDAQVWADATKACADLRPQGGGGGGGGAAYRSCMHDHNIDLPARGGPNTSTTISSGPTTTIDRNSPAFQAADKICAPLRQSGPSGTSGTSGSAGTSGMVTTTVAAGQ